MTAPERQRTAGGALARRIPVLTFHSLDDRRTPVSFAPARFVRQMLALYQNGWRTLDPSELLAGLARGAWPARSFVLTFDDGCENFREQALPILLRLGFRAIIFVVGAYTGRCSDWPGQPAWAPRVPLMDWDTLRRIADQGMLLGAHTLTHPHLPRQSAGVAAHEIADCGQLIAERTGHRPQVFAYPYGDSTPALEAIVGAHYLAGFGTRLAFCTPASRPTRLERIDMYYLQGSAAALARGRMWLAPYLALRRGLRRVRDGLAAGEPGTAAP